MRNIICWIRGHTWKLETREQHYGTIQSVMICERCGKHQTERFDFESGWTTVNGLAPKARQS